MLKKFVCNALTDTNLPAQPEKKYNTFWLLYSGKKQCHTGGVPGGTAICNGYLGAAIQVLNNVTAVHGEVPAFACSQYEIDCAIDVRQGKIPGTGAEISYRKNEGHRIEGNRAIDIHIYGSCATKSSAGLAKRIAEVCTTYRSTYVCRKGDRAGRIAAAFFQHLLPRFMADVLGGVVFLTLKEREG